MTQLDTVLSSGPNRSNLGQYLHLLISILQSVMGSLEAQVRRCIT